MRVVHPCLRYFVNMGALVTINSNKPSGDNLEGNILCFCKINLECDRH